MFVISTIGNFDANIVIFCENRLRNGEKRDILPSFYVFLGFFAYLCPKYNKKRIR